jgi:hypothetical protein
MVFNATFNNILVISWLSVLLVEETGKTINMSQVTDQHTVVSRTTRHEWHSNSQV